MGVEELLGERLIGRDSSSVFIEQHIVSHVALDGKSFALSLDELVLEERCDVEGVEAL